MKTLIFSSLVVVGLLLIGLQHQQLRDLRAENTILQQASTEANKLKADLANSTGDEARDEAEIARLREENHDLLKLRNEVNQLRDARAQFEKVSAENLRLVSLAKDVAKTESKQSKQPIVVRIVDLLNRGQNTPEDAIQTFYWAQRERNGDAFSGSVTQRSWNKFRGYIEPTGWQRENLDSIEAVEIVARRDVDATTVQLGIQFHETAIPQRFDSFRGVVIPARQAGNGRKFIVTLVLQDGEWRVDASSY
jgi:hypothetical protein